MTRWFPDLGIVVTGAPGTGSTALLDACDDAGASRLGGPKHATVAQLRAAGTEVGDGVVVVTATRNPFEYWHAEWFRSRHRWASGLDDPDHWVHRTPGLAAQVRASLELPTFGDWVSWVLRRRTPGPLNAGHVTEADVVVRREHLDDDLVRHVPALAHRLDLPLPQVNVSHGRPSFESAYDESTIDAVARSHRDDLDRFGYRAPCVAAATPTGRGS